ncbi:MAG: type II toxin-antitoxin system PemK/MazF family toxin [Rhodospirillaceae bacterium]|nr:type II toxin-antitoxin system PemK/MazF family toxin [Rhodospirillaceae bacterium]
MKDRPCAVVLVVAGARDRPRRVVVCPITHSPPDDPQTAVAIPPRVAGHLGLDQRRSWIRTHQVNVFEWKEGLIPFGVSPARPGRWSFGQLPYALGKAVFDQVLALSRKKRLVRITRT